MAPTRQEVNKAELIAKRSQVFLLCQKDTFISVLKKDNLDANEMNILLDQSRELLNLIPENIIGQFGLGGFGN